jgi:hypothetical protein
MESKQGIQIGKFATILEPNRGVRVYCADDSLARHVGRPWFRAFAAQKLGQPLSGEAPLPGGAAVVDDWILARPCVIAGKSGYGKSRLGDLLLAEQVRGRTSAVGGTSAVLIDPKGETARNLLARLGELGLDRRKVSAIDHSRPAELPGWNPFLCEGLRVEQLVGDLTAIVEMLVSGPAPRMLDLFRNACALAAHHRLSPYDLVQSLVREDVMARILALPPPAGAGAAFREAVNYFRHEVAGWAKSEKSVAYSTLLNKLRELVRNDTLLLLLSARRNTLDLASFFREQRVLLVSADRSRIGDEAARLLASLVTLVLYRSAMRGAGTKPCVLFIDELALGERMMGDLLVQVATTARSGGIRLLVALQHFDGISGRLRSALLGNASALFCFAQGYDDARAVAAAITAGRSGRLERVEVRASGGRDAEPARWRHPVEDPQGRPLRLSGEAWADLSAEQGRSRPAIPLLYRLARECGIGRLYVTAPDGGQPFEIQDYVAGLHPAEYRLEGPRLSLSVFFPMPSLTGVERSSESDEVRRYARLIQDLPVQHCLMRLPGAEPRVVRIADVPSPNAEQLAEEPPVSAATQVGELLSWRERNLSALGRPGAKGSGASDEVDESDEVGDDLEDDEGVDDGSIR